MIDTITRQPISVWSDGGPDVMPCIQVPIDQLDAVLALLDTNGVRYEVDDFALSVDNEPEVIFINLARGTDVAKVQHLLDDAS